MPLSKSLPRRCGEGGPRSGGRGACNKNCKHTKKPVKDHELIFCGNYLLSHVVSNEVPSAFERLTTVFGMGTGGTVQASSPHC